MSEQSLKIALVSYYNTYPMLYGLENDARLSSTLPHIELFKTPPAQCAELYNSGVVDIALVPVGTLSTLDEHKIITDYCIGCDGEVRTVCLFSNQPIKELDAVILDDHSRTSALLVKILLSDLTQKHISYTKKTVGLENLANNVGVLMIGDKVFEHEKEFKYCLDLGEAWKKMTGLPFVFATWVARPHISDQTIKAINSALEYGIDHIPQVIQANKISNIDLETYFLKYIKYDLDDKKLNALKLFLTKASIY